MPNSKSGYTILPLHQPYMSILTSPYPCQHLLLVSVKWNLIVVLICIKMINDTEHFSCDYRSFVFFFTEMSFQILCLFLNWVICFYIVKFFVYSGQKPLMRCMICRYLFPFNELSFGIFDVL